MPDSELINRLQGHNDLDRVLDMIDERVTQKVEVVKAELVKEMEAKIKALCNACLPAKQIDAEAFKIKMHIVLVAVIMFISTALLMPIILHYSEAAIGTELWKIEYAIIAGVLGIVGVGILGMKPQKMV